MSLKINKKQFKQWIAALDSGEYRQGCGELQNSSGYCCLGVGCMAIITESNQRIEYGRLRGLVPLDQPGAPKWLKLINDDFYRRVGAQVSEFNDLRGYTFPEIATLLELVYVHKMLD